MSQDLSRLMREKAELVAATVAEVKSIEEAYAYTVDLCDKKEACQLLISGCEQNLSAEAEALCETKQEKIMAAPALADDEFAKLAAMAEERGIRLIKEGMRNHLAGIDVGFTFCDAGIAETGTIVLKSDSEEVRLATMVSEVHVAVLPKSRIVADSYDAEPLLAELMQGPAYTAFISGPSRTADIERTLALGAHGPLELHVLLLED
ncbi:Lactate utilization protein B/C [Oleidesulfovibrio alaskensis G20]|uniref:Lactate utilization protein B/C n=1 Tax=Oleidesulfovibrio alaskensis (strain ATCC BAA-1058 / DSM 17464 / G20) TaxID=207559 RepID=Q30WA8_OLEA2|nr:lactate utilization protein [Oleidesulfovibrio alaskensis]ABB40038.1 Lactate utilization protein B/C [Oleidesulfovibrio alaskensis G20]MBG0773285.1 lactate utilization protein [Oleidesulfovibrio alaskensis]MBL3581444.1 lactate utilization protein [Oleidesulfovibrio alaskensis]